MEVVLRLRGRGLPAFSLFPVGRTSNKLRGFWGSGKSGSHPGRVAVEIRVFPRICLVGSGAAAERRVRSGRMGTAAALPHPADRPRDRVRNACQLFGQDAVIAWCEALLAGQVSAEDAGHPHIAWLGGSIGWPEYWARVWGARGLLHCGPPAQPDILFDALLDESWRVREMSLKVMRAHRLEDPDARIDALTADSVARVREAAWRALGRESSPR